VCVRARACVQTRAISGREVALATKFGAVAPTILRWLLDFGIFKHPCIYATFFLLMTYKDFHFSEAELLWVRSWTV
jgi:hypothetical protein